MAASEVNRTGRGFRRASRLIERDVRAAAESRGFAVSRLLTQWEEVAGPAIAARARPVEISYGRGFGATLTVLTTGAHAPMLEMEKETLRARINACYGYAAIARIRITQTAPTGFAEPQRGAGEHGADPSRAPDPRAEALASRAAGDVGDPSLRAALSALGARVLSKSLKG